MRAQLPLLLLAPAFLTGCSKAPEPPPDSGAAHFHHDHPPHGGTVVKLGDEEYHLELVLDGTSGKLQAYLLDSELESFVRSTSASIEITATVSGASRDLVLAAVANPETGETVGDTSLFEADAEWLKTTAHFDGVLKAIAIRGTTYSGVTFNFPNGNEGVR